MRAEPGIALFLRWLGFVGLAAGIGGAAFEFAAAPGWRAGFAAATAFLPQILIGALVVGFARLIVDAANAVRVLGDLRAARPAPAQTPAAFAPAVLAPRETGPTPAQLDRAHYNGWRVETLDGGRYRAARGTAIREFDTPQAAAAFLDSLAPRPAAAPGTVPDAAK